MPPIKFVPIPLLQRISPVLCGSTAKSLITVHCWWVFFHRRSIAIMLFDSVSSTCIPNPILFSLVAHLSRGVVQLTEMPRNPSYPLSSPSQCKRSVLRDWGSHSYSIPVLAKEHAVVTLVHIPATEIWLLHSSLSAVRCCLRKAMKQWLRPIQPPTVSILNCAPSRSPNMQPLPNSDGNQESYTNRPLYLGYSSLGSSLIIGKQLHHRWPHPLKIDSDSYPTGLGSS